MFRVDAQEKLQKTVEIWYSKFCFDVTKFCKEKCSALFLRDQLRLETIKRFKNVIVLYFGTCYSQATQQDK